MASMPSKEHLMNTLRPLSLAVACAAVLAVSLVPNAARAAWMGLNDGNDAVNLHCDLSSVIACPSDLSGHMSLAGGQVTHFDFVIDGQNFSGDPVDSVTDGSLVDTETSGLINSPFAFLSLRLITAGQIGSYAAGDRWWVYCNNLDSDSCTPSTTGTWSARAVGMVPEPAPAALLALALVAGMGRRHRAAPSARAHQRVGVGGRSPGTAANRRWV
jgi:hypothetical protein